MIKKQKNKQRGITLIALVITIIVLLILAVVSMNALFGENGIISNAKNAKEKTRGTDVKERVALAVNENLIAENSNGTKVTKSAIIQELVNQGKLTKQEADLLEENDIIEIGNIEIDFGVIDDSGKLKLIIEKNLTESGKLEVLIVKPQVRGVPVLLDYEE